MVHRLVRKDGPKIAPPFINLLRTNKIFTSFFLNESPRHQSSTIGRMDSIGNTGWLNESLRLYGVDNNYNIIII